MTSNKGIVTKPTSKAPSMTPTRGILSKPAPGATPKLSTDSAGTVKK